MFQIKYKKPSVVLGILLSVLFIGIAIPKLTVHDLVQADERAQNCAAFGVNQQFDNSFERIAILLGKTRITQMQDNDVGVEAFTLFRIPLGILRGQPGMSLGVTCDYAVSEYSSDQFGISFTYPSSYDLSEGNGEGSAAEAYFIGLAPRPAPAPELPPGVQVDLEPIPGIGFAFYRNLDSTETPEAWIHDQMTYRAGEGNFQDPPLHSIMVDGVPAVRYLDTSGLYQRDTVLFRYDGRIVQIAADDATYFNKSDFDSILSSITFH